MKSAASSTASLGRFATAEFLGTALLAMAVAATIAGTSSGYPDFQAAFIPFVIGAVLAGLVYFFGPYSGAQFNPAVTVALFMARRITVVQLLAGWAMQIAGAWVGFRTALFFLGPLPDVPQPEMGPALAAEAIGAFVLMAGIMQAVLRRVPEAMQGVVIGLSLMTGILLSLPVSGGLLNPALALALGSLSPVYLAGPVIGTVIAAAVFLWLSGPVAADSQAGTGKGAAHSR